MSHPSFWHGPQEPLVCFLSSSAEVALALYTLYADHFRAKSSCSLHEVNYHRQKTPVLTPN